MSAVAAPAQSPIARRRSMPVQGLAWLALGLAGAPAAQADQALWELGAGAGALRLPQYRGSDQSHDWVLPVPYVVYRGQILRADREGARAAIVNSERVDVDLGVDASAPTRGGDNRARAGMPDLAGTLEIGPNLNLALAKGMGWKFDLRVPLHAAFTLQSRPRAIGWTLGPVLNLDIQVQGWKLGLQGGPMAASQRYHGYFYDVAPAYATTVRPAYRAAAGAAGWHFTASTSRRLGDWWLGAFVRADSLAGAVFDASPLVKRRDNLAFGLAISRVFMTSDQRVADDR